MRLYSDQGAEGRDRRPLNLERGVRVGLMTFALMKGSKEIFPACHTTAALQMWSSAWVVEVFHVGPARWFRG